MRRRSGPLPKVWYAIGTIFDQAPLPSEMTGSATSPAGSAVTRARKIDVPAIGTGRVVVVVVVEEVVVVVEEVVVVVEEVEEVVRPPWFELHAAAKTTSATDTVSAVSCSAPRRRSRANPEGPRASLWNIKRGPSGTDPVRPRC